MLLTTAQKVRASNSGTQRLTQRDIARDIFLLTATDEFEPCSDPEPSGYEPTAVISALYKNVSSPVLAA